MGSNPDLIEPPNDESDPEREELEALGRIAHAFREYKIDADWEVKRWEYNYSKLSPAHQELLFHIPAKIAAARQCVYQNHLFFKSLLGWLSPDAAPEPLCYASPAAEAWAAQHGPQVNPADADKVRYVLKNAMRDWSEEGAAERAESYGLIVSELASLLAPQLQAAAEGQAPPPKVLVPGCGLARLCAELAAIGCETLGNEHSYYMLMASAFILNATNRADQWTLFPWIHSSNNHISDANQLRPVTIPDTTPSDLIERTAPGLLGMAAGEFVEVFKSEEFFENFDSIATCFFIDTAHNIIEYLETIWSALRPGGYWVNLGPLQWHWADAHTYLPGDELSIEISLSAVQRVAQKMGFVFLKRETGLRCRYMCDNKAMLHQGWECAFWVAQKPVEADEGDGGGGSAAGAAAAGPKSDEK